MQGFLDRERRFRLQHIRRTYGMTQMELAKELGVSDVTISRWERGKATLYPAAERRLRAFFQEQGEPERNPSATSGALLMDISCPSPLPLIGREGETQRLRRLLLGDPQIITLSGLPGVGKTALAAALVHQQEIHAHYDGILWARMGTAPPLGDILRRWGRLLGVSPRSITQWQSVEEGVQEIRLALQGRTVLIVLDDVWTAAAACTLALPSCTYLVTTRLPRVAASLSEADRVSVGALSHEASMKLLRRLAPEAMRQELEPMRELTAACCGLPLALTLMGQYLHREGYAGQKRRIHAAVNRLTSAAVRLHLCEPARIDHSSGQQARSLFETVALSDQQLVAREREAFYAIGRTFLPQPSTFSEEEALDGAVCASDTLDALVDAGLLDHQHGRYSMHPILSDYICFCCSAAHTDELRSAGERSAEAEASDGERGGHFQLSNWERTVHTVAAGETTSVVVAK